MSQHTPQSGQELLPLPDFHDDEDLFDDEASLMMHPRRRRILIILSIVLLPLLLIGGVLVVKFRTHVVYQTRRVVQGDLVLTVNTTGALHTNVYTVDFMGTGKLAVINVAVGQQVTQGQILAKLDPTSLQNAFDEAQVNVEAAQTALDNANANYTAIQSASQYPVAGASTASVNSVRISPGGSRVNTTTQPEVVVPGQTGGTDRVQEVEALGQIKAAQKALTLAQTKLDTAKYNLNNAILKAPHGGTVATLNGVVGGEPGATFIQIVDPASLQLQANVSETDVGSVAVGDAVSFSVDAYPGQSFNGNVEAISPLGQSTSGVVTYPVLITMVSAVPASIHLFPGMTAHARIITKERTGVLVVPASALAFARAAEKPRAETGNQAIIEHSQMQNALSRANDMLQNQQQNVSQENAVPAVVLERNAYDKITAIPIVVGLTNGTEYEVLDGLSASDVVLVRAWTSSN
ncbi:MAG: efflux RND transporter periplasmic adaptor subunit [Ktedonobacteraceae bacterium]|nr:efflux RND transporter periplasmic adaptor subunit [Ktedonobacteraceae bacterium]